MRCPLWSRPVTKPRKMSTTQYTLVCSSLEGVYTSVCSSLEGVYTLVCSSLGGGGGQLRLVGWEW